MDNFWHPAAHKDRYINSCGADMAIAAQCVGQMAWAAQQKLEATRRRTIDGLARVRSEGKALGPPLRVTDDQVKVIAKLKRQGSSYRTIGKLFGESGSTVLRCLRTDHYDKGGRHPGGA